MPKLTIDHREVEVEPGSTILYAARKLGIDIPTLCFREGYQPSTSCMVCVVKVSNRDMGHETQNRDTLKSLKSLNVERLQRFPVSSLKSEVSSPESRLIPSCATVAEEGMEVESETDEVHEARRTALELLLSDHVGDCIAPCHRTCPAGMNIPLMIRQISAGKLRDAIATVKRDIALPAVLGRICPAPCEKGCRRAAYDSPVSICLLKRYAADVDLMSESPYLPSCKPQNGKKVAIVGAGPTGLAAAYYLLQEGYACTIFDDHEKPGGMMQYAVPEDRLPRKVLDAEIGLIGKLGAEFRMKTKIGEQLSIPDLQRDYDAVLIATGAGTGERGSEEARKRGSEEARERGSMGLGEITQIHRDTLQTNLKGIFVGGNPPRTRGLGRRSNMAVRSVADGKAAAISIDQYVSDLPITGLRKPFTVHMGRLAEGEIQRFMADVSESQRVTADEETGFSGQEARIEAGRCLHCDCRKADNCKLRDYAQIYEADPNRYKAERKLFEQYVQHPREGVETRHAVSLPEPYVIYEPGKCIKCGLCVQITSNSSEALGLTFIGRGFNVRVGVPFNRSIAEGLQKVAAQCVAACPTGALAFR